MVGGITDLREIPGNSTKILDKDKAIMGLMKYGKV